MEKQNERLTQKIMNLEFIAIVGGKKVDEEEKNY